MSGAGRPLRPGDVFRVDRRFPKNRLDDDRIDFLRVHYETDSPGLAHVVEVSGDGVIFDLWGHRFRTPMRADQIRPLGTLARLLAPERLGEAILRREVEAGKVAMDGSSKPTRQPLVRLWLRKTRGPLPVLETLGGRIRLPVMRKAKSRLHYWLGNLGVMPPLNGFLDHGMLVDRIGVTVELGYSSGDRTFRLDRILLHKNHSIHLIGIDLDAGEQRTFRLDKVWSMSIPGLGDVDMDDLYWELQSLCMSREGWLWYWNRHQERHGRPPGPPIGPVGRALSKLGKLAETTTKKAGAVAPALPKARSQAKWKWIFAKTAVLRRVREVRQEERTPSRKAVRRAALLAEMPTWRRRLLIAIDVAGSGGYEQVTCLLPMNALLETDPMRCRAYLRHLMELTLEEATADPSGHPVAVQVLTEALALSRDLSEPIPLSERSDARTLLIRIRNLQPGWKRIWIHAGRRKAADARLLLCESYLSAVYHVQDANNPVREEPIAGPPEQWDFYRAGCHFVSRWDNLRFRVDATSVPKLKAIVDWWDAWVSCPPEDAMEAPLPDEVPIEVRFAATKSLWFDMVFIAGRQGRLVEVADTMWDAGELLRWVAAIVAGRPAVMECDREGVIDEVRSEPVDEDRVRLTISEWQGDEVYLDAVVGRQKLVWEIYWELANIDRLLDRGHGDYVRGWWRLPEAEKWLDWGRTGRSLELYDPVAGQSRLGNRKG